MAHRSKELMRAVRDELERHNIRVTGAGKTGGSHQYVEFEYHGTRQKLCFAFSPHSSATDYVRQAVRRRLREVDAGRAVIGAAVPGGHAP